MSEDLADVFVLIKEYCTAGQMKELLKDWQKKIGKKSVHIGKNMGEHLSNLREALNSNAIPAHELYEMLRRAEENGDQHILFYLPRNPRAKSKLDDGLQIAESLFGQNWENDRGFPKFNLLPDKYIWVDFRRFGKNWTGKLYGHEIRKKIINREEKGDDIELVTYQSEKFRHVCVIHWNGHALEIRLSRSQNSSSKRNLEEKENAVWLNLDSAFTRASMVPWDLNLAKRQFASDYLEMLKKDPSSAGPKTKVGYWLSDQEFLSPQNEKISYHPQAEEDAHSDLALNLFKSMSVCPCSELAIHWSPIEGLFDAPFTTYCGGLLSNEITIQSSVSPEALNHVTSRFREFEKRAAGSD